MNQVILALVGAIILGLVLGPIVIPFLRRLKFGQSIRSEGPQSHHQKAGTPTMGGIIFIIATVVATLVFAGKSGEAYLALGTMVAFGIIGFLDDFIKVVMKRNLGLTAKQKLLGQVLIALGLAYFADFYLHRGTDVVIPFIGTEYHLSWGLFFVFTLCVVLGATNGVNFTDGLDGLAAGTTVFAGLGFGLIAIAMGKMGLAVFMAAVVGGCIAFLFFNFHPAKVFMGDTGSLALGGALAAVAIITRTELFLPLIGGVYVLEVLSVIIQVISFKTTGKRVFKMSPLHHHFELSGWSEKKVVTVFWSVALLFAVIGILGIKGIG